MNEKEEVIFIINWRDDINTQMLIEYCGKYYDITRIDDYEGYKKDLSVYCKLSARQSPDDPEGGV